MSDEFQLGGVSGEKLLEWRGDGTVWAKFPDGRYVEVIEKPAHGLHCATCQCNKFPPTPPVPENPRSKSWHENALTAPPK